MKKIYIIVLSVIMSVSALALMACGGESANKANLKELIESCEELEEATYTVATWEPFFESLEAAIELRDDSSALQQNIDAAVTDLTAKKAALVTRQHVVDEFRMVRSSALNLSPATVTVSSKKAVADALTAYAALGDEIKAMLTTEKALLDSLSAKINELETAANVASKVAAFRNAHSEILGIDIELLRIDDEDLVTRALAAYNVLAENVREALTEEKNKLDSLNNRIEQLKYAILLDAAKLAKQQQVPKLSDYPKENYTEESWNAFRDAVNADIAAINNCETLEQVEVYDIKADPETLVPVTP